MTAALQIASAAIDAAARRSADRAVSDGARLYQRTRDLPKLLGHRCLIMSRGEIIEALENAIGASAKMIQAGHRDADLNRHVALRQALAAERSAA